MVIGIARGGVPVAAEVARALHSPLDVAVVRKIGAPQNPEFAIGALAEGEVHVLSERAVQSPAPARRRGGAPDRPRRARAGRARAPLPRRHGEPIDLVGRVAVLIDDGLATGRTALAAVRSLRRRGAARVILAVPVASPEAAEALAREADEVVCVERPEDLWAVGYWYRDFSPTSDAEVAELLRESAAAAARRAAGDRSAVQAASGGRAAAGSGEEEAAEEVSIPIGGGAALGGSLSVPERARGVVAFAHGSGSSRLSPRNRAVAHALGRAGFATLLCDLLTPAEEADRANVFDIPLLASGSRRRASGCAAAPTSTGSRWATSERAPVRRPRSALPRRPVQGSGRSSPAAAARTSPRAWQACGRPRC